MPTEARPPIVHVVRWRAIPVKTVSVSEIISLEPVFLAQTPRLADVIEKLGPCIRLILDLPLAISADVGLRPSVPRWQARYMEPPVVPDGMCLFCIEDIVMVEHVVKFWVPVEGGLDDLDTVACRDVVCIYEADDRGCCIARRSVTICAFAVRCGPHNAKAWQARGPSCLELRDDVILRSGRIAAHRDNDFPWQHRSTLNARQRALEAPILHVIERRWNRHGGVLSWWKHGKHIFCCCCCRDTCRVQWALRRRPLGRCGIVRRRAGLISLGQLTFAGHSPEKKQQGKIQPHRRWLAPGELRREGAWCTIVSHGLAVNNLLLTIYCS